MSELALPWIFLPALLAGAFFSTLHLALREMASVRLQEISIAGARPAASRRVTRILEDVDGHSNAVALPGVLCHVVAILSLVGWILTFVPDDASPVFGVGVGLLIATPVAWLLGVAIPQSLAAHSGERLVYALSGVLRATHVAATPLRSVAVVSDEIVRRLVGASEPGAAEEIEADLLSVVEEGEREGQFDETAREMIEAVVKFRNTSVDEIMTPRTDIEAVAITDDIDEIKQLLRETKHSRIPMFEENVDHIAGILYARDVLLWMASDQASNGTPFNIRSILRPAMFVPETKTVRDLLKELVAQKIHICMVTDEYGGTAGLVTMEDIVEEIFGEIQDEYETREDAPPDVTVDQNARSAEVDARAHIDDANDELKVIGVALPESEEYDTVGGFVMASLGHIPVAGEQMRHEDAMLTILEAEPTRVGRVRIDLADDGEPEVASG